MCNLPEQSLDPPLQPYLIEDDIPQEQEIEKVVKRLKGGKSPGPSGLHVDTIKEWLVEDRKDTTNSSSHWKRLVINIQDIFKSKKLPESVCNQTLVMIPKEDQGEFRGIGLIETMWKILSSIINSRIQRGINYQEFVHGFRQKKEEQELLSLKSNYSQAWP